jgi:hypothetical protein
MIRPVIGRRSPTRTPAPTWGTPRAHFFPSHASDARGILFVMPVHDWLKVSQGIFHDFHNAWVFEIKRV